MEEFQEYKIIRSLFTDKELFPLKPLRYSSHSNYGRAMTVVVHVSTLCHVGYTHRLFFDRLCYFSNMMYQAINRKPHLNLNRNIEDQKFFQQCLTRMHGAYRITGIFQLPEEDQRRLSEIVCHWADVFGALTIIDIEKLEANVNRWLDKQPHRS